VSKLLKESAPLSEETNDINYDQIMFIDTKCRKLNIDVEKFINSGESNYKNIYEVKKDVASKMIKRLTELSSGSKQITEDIFGYKKDWNK